MPPTGRVCPAQVSLAIAKSVAFAPERPVTSAAVDASPALVTWNVCAAALASTSWSGKSKLDGETVTALGPASGAGSESAASPPFASSPPASPGPPSPGPPASDAVTPLSGELAASCWPLHATTASDPSANAKATNHPARPVPACARALPREPRASISSKHPPGWHRASSAVAKRTGLPFDRSPLTSGSTIPSAEELPSIVRVGAAARQAAGGRRERAAGRQAPRSFRSFAAKTGPFPESSCFKKTNAWLHDWARRRSLQRARSALV